MKSLKNWFQNLPERVATVLIFAPIPILLVILSPLTSWLVISVLVLLAVWEWRKIILGDGELLFSQQTQIVILGSGLAMFVALFNISMGVVLILGLGVYVFFNNSMKRRVDLTIAQIIPGLVGLGAYFLRSGEHGLALFGLILVVTSTSDTAAYYVGRAIGKHKFAPKISPNKTWEGAIGGWVFAILFSILYCHFFLPSIAQFGIFLQILFFWLLAFAGQLGDLGESSIKRKYGVKDSSNIFPGHGGVMDRFDSFSAVIAVMSLVGAFVAL